MASLHFLDRVHDPIDDDCSPVCDYSANQQPNHREPYGLELAILDRELREMEEQAPDHSEQERFVGYRQEFR